MYILTDYRICCSLWLSVVKKLKIHPSSQKTAGFHLKIKAVIFDMDGVITNTMPDHFRAWRKVLLIMSGISVTKRDIYLREGQPGSITLREIFREKGHAIGRAQAQEILQAKEKLFKKIVRRRFVPGARGFLRYLKNNGFTLGLVTGTARHEVERILPRPIMDLFSVVVTGCEVKKGKPHPEPYLMALKKLKIRSKEAVVIENAPFGIRSAKRARLRCLALETSLPRSFLKEADFISSTYADLRRAVCFIKHPPHTP